MEELHHTNDSHAVYELSKDEKKSLEQELERLQLELVKLLE